MGFFGWLTQRTKAAILSGFNQAIEEIEQTHGDTSEVTLQLVSRDTRTTLPVEVNGRKRQTAMR